MERDWEIPAGAAEALLAWYDACARVLPWRSRPEPYRVWVSEIMLQQTRVETVLPYFERFLSALPTAADLAAAPEERLLKLWEGLGYYSRARNLQKAAGIVVERYGGELPASFEELKKLPGVGDYTAGAVASIAFGLPEPAVDGNVLRVLSRLLAREEDVSDPAVKRRAEAAVRRVLPEERPGDFNQALMDLGATVCLPNAAPKCSACPWERLCAARERGIQESLPVKAAKKQRKIQQRTVFLLRCEGRLALRRRPERGLLAGMWELPAVEETLSPEAAAALLRQWGAEGPPEKLPEVRHVFTHVEWRMSGWGAELRRPDARFVWAGPEALRGELSLPSAFKKYTALFLDLFP